MKVQDVADIMKHFSDLLFELVRGEGYEADRVVFAEHQMEVLKRRLVRMIKKEEGKMKMRVTKVNEESIEFENGEALSSYHDQDCCESHFLSFKDLSIKDFEGLDFDLSGDSFFERVEGYGIALKPVNGHPVRVPGYGFNNGYYNSNLDLVLGAGENKRVFDISECQAVKD